MKTNADKIYAETLYKLLEEGKDMDSVIFTFLNFLKQKSKLDRIEKIIKQFEKIYNSENNIAGLKIRSAHELDTKIVQRIAKSLNLEKYELQTEIDKELIGGFVAQYNDNLIDASIKNNLNKLHNQLKN